MRPLIEQAIGWDEYRMEMHFARQWNLGQVRIIAVSNRDIGWLHFGHAARRQRFSI
jgi:hypothetical protein